MKKVMWRRRGCASVGASGRRGRKGRETAVGVRGRVRVCVRGGKRAPSAIFNFEWVLR